MKSKVILFCVLLFSSKIVESIPHSEGLLRQRVNPPSIWQGNQNAQDAQYLDPDFTQTRKVNTLTNSAIQQESIQDYNVNQGRHNYEYNDYGYNKSPASASSGKEVLESYNLQTDGRRLESYPPRVESYPSEVRFDNQPFRKQNWRPQNLYTNSVPSAVLVTDNERPLVNTVQEPYRAPVQYLQPKYVPSSNQRFYQPERSYLTREQFQYPLANNAGDSYVANSRPHFGSNGPVPNENYSEVQARASEIKSKLTDGQRYLHNLAPQSRNYNEIPVVIATDSLTDQSENIKYLENYRSRSDLSNTASSTSYEDSSPIVENYRSDSRLSKVPESLESTRLSGDRRHTQSFAPQSETIYNESPAVITTDTLEDQFKNVKSVENYRSRSDLSETVPTTNYNDDSPVISAADDYNLNFSPNNGPVSYESYSDAQALVSEVNPRPIQAKRYVQNFAPQSRIIYNDIPAVIAADVLADQSKNIRYEESENYKSRSDVSSTASIINYDDDSSVITTAETRNEGSRPIHNHVPHTKYDNSQAALSGVRPRPIGGRKYLQKVAPPSRIIYNDVPTVIETDVLADQSNNIRYEKREDYKSRSDLSNIAPGANQDDSSPVISIVDNIDSDSKPSNPAPENIEKRAPLDVNKVLSDKPLARRYAYNYRSAIGSSNDVVDNFFNGTPNVISETIEEKLGAYEDNYGQNEPIPINSETSPTSTHTVPTKQRNNNIEESDIPSYGSSIPTPSNNPTKQHKMKELNLNKFNIQKLMDGSSKPYLVIHPNGTVEHLDTIDLDSQQNSYLRLVNTKRINVGDTESDETQLPEIAPNNIAKTFVPLNEIPLPADTQPADYRKSPLNVNQVNSAYESDSKLPNKVLSADQSISKSSHVKQQADSDNLKPETPLVNQPVEENNSKLPLFIQQDDGDKFKPLRPFIRNRVHHYKSKPTDVNLLAVEKSKPRYLNENQSDDNDSYLSSPGENQPSDVNNAYLPLTENQSENDKNSEPMSRPFKRWPHKRYYKSKLTSVNQPTENSDSSPSSNENQPLDDNNYKTLPLNENQPIADIDSQILNLHERKPVRNYTSKHSHLKRIRDVDIVSSLSPSENNLADDNDSNSSPPDNNKPKDDNHSKLSNDSQPGNNNKFKPIHSHYPAPHNEDKSTHEHLSKHNKKYPKNKPEDDKNSNSSSLDENKTDYDTFLTNKPKEDIKFKLLNPPKRQPALHNEPKLSHKGQSEIDEISPQNKSEDGNNSNLWSPGNNQSTDDDTSEIKPEDNDKYKLLNLHKGKPANHNKQKLSHEDQSENIEIFPKNTPGEDYKFNSSSPDDNESIDDDTFLEGQPRNNKKTKPIHQHHRKPAHNKPKPSYEDQSENVEIFPKTKPEDNVDSNSWFPDDNESKDDNTFLESQPRNNKKTKPIHQHHRNPAHHNKPKPSYEDQSQNNDTSPQNKPEDDKIFKLSSLDENKSTDDDTFPTNKSEEDLKSKPLSLPKRQSALHNEPKLSQKDQSEIDEIFLQNKSEVDNNSNLWSPGNKQSTDHDASENNPDDNNKSKLLNQHKEKPAHHHKPKLSYKDQSENVEILPKTKPEDDYNFNSSSPDDNQSIDDNTFLENQPRNKKTKPIHPHHRKPAHHNKPKPSYEDQSENNDMSPQNKPEDDKISNLSSLDENKATDDTFPTNKPEEDIKSILLNPPKRQPALHNEPKLSHKDQSEIDEISPQNKSEDDNNSKLWSPGNNQSTDDDNSENKPEDNNKSKLLNLHTGKPAHHNKPKLSHKDQSENVKILPKSKPGDDYNFNSSAPDDNESIDDDTFLESQPRNSKKTKPIYQHYTMPAYNSEPKPSYEDQSENDDTSPENKPEDDFDSNSWFPDDNESIEDDTFLENQQQNNKKNKPIYPQPARHNEPKPSHGDQAENDDTSSQNEPEYDVNSDTSFLDENQSEEDNTYPQNNPEDDSDSDSPLAEENESEHIKKTKPKHTTKKQLTVSKTDNQPVSTILSLAAPNYTKSPKSQVAKTHKHRHISQKPTTTSLSVTTPYPNETPEDQIITLSPIEQVTDNVSDIPPVTTTTTTAKPIKTPGKSKKRKNRPNSSSKDFASITDKVQTPSTKASTSNLTTPTDSTSDDKTIKATVLNNKTQTIDNKVESQVNNVKNDTQTIQSAVYDSSELLDTITDVLAESDDNSPVIKSPSVQRDVNTCDISGANTLEFEQPETDVIITVSSSTDNDFEGDIITINVEVFESPGLFSNNKSLLVNIDTNNESDDDPKTKVPSDCEKDQNGVDDGRGKNLEIDLSNFQGEPTMWIRTTNQDFIDKLMNKNETAFDMIYFFNIVNQPAIEREKVTTIHCNGTVVIETKEITFAHKDDPTPTIVKTTQTIQIDDYKRQGLDSLND